MGLMSKIKKLDLNGNGIADVEEIAGLIRNKLDFDGDGKVDINDLKFKIKEILLSKYDKDEDKKFSVEEVANICVDVVLKLRKLF